MTSSAPWSAEDIRQNAHSWTLDGDAKLLEFMQNISNSLESRAEQTNRNLNHLMLNLNQTSISLENSANKLSGLQHSQFVENRVYDDDETIANRSQVPVEVESDKDNYNPIETLNKVLQSGVETLSKCYDKVSIDVEDSDDEEGLASSVIFRPKDPYEQHLLPHIIGSKEWKEEWHIGLCESEEDYSDEENKEDFSNSSENGSLSASIPSNAPTMSESESSIWGLQPNPPKKRPALYAPSSDEDISSNTATSKTSSDGFKRPHPSQFNHNLILPPPEEKYYVHKPKDKGLFDESSDESDREFKIPKKQEKPSINVVSNIFNDEPPELDEVDRKQEKNPEKLFCDSGDDEDQPVVVAVPNTQQKSDLKTSNILKKPVNLFDDDDFDSFMQELDKKATEKTTQNTGKEDVKNLFDNNSDEGEDIFAASKTKSAQKQDTTVHKKSQLEQKKKTPPENGLAKPKLFDDDDSPDIFSNFSSANITEKNSSAGLLKTKITNLFDDDSPDDDFDSLFGNAAKKIEKKQPPKLPEKKSADVNKSLSLGPDNKEMPLPASRKKSDLFVNNSVDTAEDDLFSAGTKQPVAVPRTIKSTNNNVLVNNHNASLSSLEKEEGNSTLRSDDNFGKTTDSKTQKEAEPTKPEISKSTSIKAANLFTDEFSDEDDLFKISTSNNTSAKTSTTTTTTKRDAAISKLPSLFLDEASDEEDLFKTLKTSLDKNSISKRKDLPSSSIKADFNPLPQGRIETIAYVERTLNDSDSKSMDSISTEDAKNIRSEKVDIILEKPLPDDDLFISGKNVEVNRQSNSKTSKEDLSVQNDEIKSNSSNFSNIKNKMPNLFFDEPPDDDDDLFNSWKNKSSQSKVGVQGNATKDQAIGSIKKHLIESSDPVKSYQSEKLSNDIENSVGATVSDKPKEDFERLAPKSQLEEKLKTEPKIEYNAPSEPVAESNKNDENKVEQQVEEKLAEIAATVIENTKPVPEKPALPSLFDDEPPVDDDWLTSSIKTNTKAANKTDESLENDDEEDIKNSSALAYNPLSLFQDIPPEDDFETPSETKRLYNIFYDDFSETITSADISSRTNAVNYFFSDEPPPDNFDSDAGIEYIEKKFSDVKPDSKILEKFDEIPKVKENLSKVETVEIDKASVETKTESKNEEQTISNVKTLDQDPNAIVENVSVADLIKKASTTEPQKPPFKPNTVIPKKLNTNLNINVAALMPGAKRPSLKLEENEKNSVTTPPVEEIKEEPSTTPITVAHSESDPSRLISFNKTRAKILVKRRPSTRLARQQSYEKSVSHDIDNSDGSPDHSPESKSSSDNQTLNMIPSLPESPTSSLFEAGDKSTNEDDDWATSKQNTVEIKQNFEQNNNKTSNTVNNNENNNNKKVDSVPNLPVEESKQKLLKKQPAMSSSSLFGDDSDEEDLFGQLSSKTKSRDDPPKKATNITEDRPKRAESTQKRQQSSSKLFSSDEGDDDDIFGKPAKSAAPIKTAEKIVAKKLPISTSKNLFDDDDDEDDLFGGPHSKHKDSAKRTIAPKKMEKKSDSTPKGSSSSDNPLADLLKD